MTGKRRAETALVEDWIVAILRDAEGFPLSARQVIEAVGPRRSGQPRDLYPVLHRLAREGRIEEVRVSAHPEASGFPSLYWRVG